MEKVMYFDLSALSVNKSYSAHLFTLVNNVFIPKYTVDLNIALFVQLILTIMREDNLNTTTYGNSAKLSVPPKLTPKMNTFKAHNNVLDSLKPPECLKLKTPEWPEVCLFASSYCGCSGSPEK